MERIAYLLLLSRYALTLKKILKAEVVITSGIMDYAASNADKTAKGLENPSVTTFTTKIPQVYDLSTQDQFQSTSMEDIALYTYTNSGPYYGRTFAYINGGISAKPSET